MKQSAHLQPAFSLRFGSGTGRFTSNGKKIFRVMGSNTSENVSPERDQTVSARLEHPQIQREVYYSKV